MRLLYIIVLGSCIASCSFYDNRPKQAQDALEKKINEESDGYIKLIDFKKQDGKEIGEGNYKQYILEFSGFFQYQKNCYKSGGYSTFLYTDFSVWTGKPTGWDAYDAGYVVERLKGLKVGFMGEALFEQKESGWHLVKIKITETKDGEVEPIAEEYSTEQTNQDKTIGQKRNATLPFIGKKFYDTHPVLSGSGTPRYFVEIKDNGDVYFGYDAPNMNGADIHEKIYAGKYKPIMECNNDEYATGRFFAISSTLINEVDETGHLISNPDCCDSWSEDDTPCPCDSKLW